MIDEIRNDYSNLILNSLRTLTSNDVDVDTKITDNPFKNIAIGICLKEKFPNNSKGYVFLYDAFYYLGEDYLSFKQILNYVSNNGMFDYESFKILVVRLAKIKEFDGLLLLFKNHSDLAKRILNDKCFSKFCSAESIKILFTIIYEDFKNNIIKTDEDLRIIEAFDVIEHTDNEIISFYKQLNSYRKIWFFTMKILLLRKACSKEIFDILKVKHRGEKDYSDRLSFVYRIMNKNFPMKIDSLIYFVKSLLFYGENSRAYLSLSKYLLNGGEYSFDIFSLMQVIKLRTHRNQWSFNSFINLSDNVCPQVKKILTNEFSINLSKDFKVLDFYKSSIVKFKDSLSFYSNQLPRVAICISGQVRSSLKPVYKMLNNISNADFYISTWDRGNFCEENTMFHLGKLLGKELLSKLPTNYQNLESFAKVFPLTYKKLTNKFMFEITKDYLLKDLNANNVVVDVESEDEFNDFLKNNLFKTLIKESDSSNGKRKKVSQCKQFYKISRAFDMCEKSLNEYDVVVRGRTDYIFDLPNIDEFISLVNQDKSLLVTYYYNTCDIGDQFCIGSYEAMRCYCNLWKHISDSKMLRYSDKLSKESEFGAEPLLAAHLASNNMHIKMIKVKNTRKTTLPSINYFDITEEIKADMELCTNNSIFLDFINTYAQGKINRITWNF